MKTFVDFSYNHLAISSSMLLMAGAEMSSNHPLAYCFNAILGKLLALQLVPFQSAELDPFHKFKVCARTQNFIT